MTSVGELMTRRRPTRATDYLTSEALGQGTPSVKRPEWTPEGATDP
jgi:hypothetical protein